MIRLNKLFIFILYSSLIYSTDNNYTAIGIMGKVINAPKPISSISEIEFGERRVIERITIKSDGKSTMLTTDLFDIDKFTPYITGLVSYYRPDIAAGLDCLWVWAAGGFGCWLLWLLVALSAGGFDCWWL